MGIVTAFLVGIGAKLAADEVKAWSPRLSVAILRLAVRRGPQEHRARLEEELLADLDRIPGDLSKLLWALDSIRGVRGISNDCSQPTIPPNGSPGAIAALYYAVRPMVPLQWRAWLNERYHRDNYCAGCPYCHSKTANEKLPEQEH